MQLNLGLLLLILCGYSTSFAQIRVKKKPFAAEVSGDRTEAFSLLVDSRDGERYKTGLFGEKRWMIENLRYDIPGVYGFSDTVNLKSPNKTYGRLYSWFSVMNIKVSRNQLWERQTKNYQGICPDGWHLPTVQEWQQLKRYILSSSSFKARAWNSKGSAVSGFDVLPAGLFGRNGFEYLGKAANYWTANEQRINSASYIFFIDKIPRFRDDVTDKRMGFSCRCVEN